MPIGSFTLSSAVGLARFNLGPGRSLWRSDLAFLLLLYPVWGIVQQTIFQGLLHRRLMVLIGLPFLQVVITALAFAAVHAGNLALYDGDPFEYVSPCTGVIVSGVVTDTPTR